MADSAAVAVVGKARARKPAAPRGAVAAGRKVLPRKRKGVVHRKGGIVLEDVSDEEGLREVDAVCAKEVAGFITGDDEIVPASDEEPEESLSASCGDSASSSSDSDDSDDDSDRVDGETLSRTAKSEQAVSLAHKNCECGACNCPEKKIHVRVCLLPCVLQAQRA